MEVMRVSKTLSKPAPIRKAPKVISNPRQEEVATSKVTPEIVNLSRAMEAMMEMPSIVSSSINVKIKSEVMGTLIRTTRQSSPNRRTTNRTNRSVKILNRPTLFLKKLLTGSKQVLLQPTKAAIKLSNLRKVLRSRSRLKPMINRAIQRLGVPRMPQPIPITNNRRNSPVAVLMIRHQISKTWKIPTRQIRIARTPAMQRI